MKSAKKKWFASSFFFLAASFLIVFIDIEHNYYYTEEDSWVENITALAYLASSVVLFIAYSRSSGYGYILKGFRTNRNFIYLILGCLFFIAFGEEISWGQRIFNWSTPENFAKINVQKETNIHNLEFFVFKNEVGDSFLSFLLVFNPGRIFFYFWFSYMVILAFLNERSTKSQQFFRKLNIPIPSLWIGILMLCNLLIGRIFKYLTKGLEADYPGSIDEIMEANYSILILILSFNLYHKLIHLSTLES